MRRICKYCGATFEGDPAALACPECVEARKGSVMRDRTCRTCGAVFPGGPRAWYCPACRAERRRQHDREHKQRQRAGMVRRIGDTAYCERCGQPYTVTGSLQRYCPDCAPEAIREAGIALSRAWNAEHATPEQRRTERHRQTASIPCRVCGLMFVPRGPAETCSPECAAELKRRDQAAYEVANRDARNAYHRQLRAEKLAGMTEEERRAYLDRVNARARENYRKRREKEKDES